MREYPEWAWNAAIAVLQDSGFDTDAIPCDRIADEADRLMAKEVAEHDEDRAFDEFQWRNSK